MEDKKPEEKIEKEIVKENKTSNVNQENDNKSQASKENSSSPKSEEDNKKPDVKKEVVEKKETKKDEKPKGPKKNEAVVNGRGLQISTKHSIAICNFIRGKHIDRAISELEEVLKMKRAIPMRGEIPHRKGMMSGRYPLKAAGVFIKLLKSLKSNAMINELELEKYEIYCMANLASRPYKRFGKRRSKRSNVQFKLIPLKKKKRKNKSNGGEK